MCFVSTSVVVTLSFEAPIVVVSVVVMTVMVRSSFVILRMVTFLLGPPRLGRSELPASM